MIEIKLVNQMEGEISWRPCGKKKWKGKAGTMFPGNAGKGGTWKRVMNLWLIEVWANETQNRRKKIMKEFLQENWS